MSDNEIDPTSLTATVANPGPLGLFSAAITIFVMSAANAKLFTGPQAAIGLAFFYGGVVQLLAGMWEFRMGNTFGATAFSSYGAFWMIIAANIQFGLLKNSTGFPFYLLGWTIFTFIMLLGTLKTNIALILLFGLLFITFVLLTYGAFHGGSTDQLSGYFGLSAAAVAYYAAAAGLLASGKSAFHLPVGPIS